MKKKILIMGLPGAGKTTLAEKLVKKIDAIWINADEVRRKYNDWDFSNEGRLRQANRMKSLANDALNQKKHVVVDFVCPTPETRNDFNPDFLIWVDTIKKGRFEDTNKMFIPPSKFDFRVETKNADLWSDEIKKILKD
jgi:adenylylsulfate kinase|tara:strand:+ start:45 stop:458 length:414 start_codon:yes stop_codon:yes gene_type:complete